jgi:hypothetical protein
MMELDGGSVAVAYLGAGAFYVGSDIISGEWSKQRPPPFTVLAMVFGAAAWGPACLLAILANARTSWRQALTYVAHDVVPPLMIMIGGLIVASVGIW